MVAVNRELQPIKPPNFILYADSVGMEGPTHSIAVEKLPLRTVEALCDQFRVNMVEKHRQGRGA